MPDTIAAVLDLRLGRISSDCQRLLVRAAVLGGSFEFSALRALESGPTASDEDTLLDLLEEALQAGMLSEEGSGTRITYHFWHPLLVSHLYDGLSAGRRASLHRRAADALMRLYSDRAAESAAAIAFHLVNGGSDPATIAHYAELAGDRAYALSAYPEAVRHYKLALENIGTLAASASADDHLRLANLLERLGECTRILGNDEEARGYFERALEVRNHYKLIMSNLNEQYEAQIDALLWVEIGITWYYRGDNERAIESYSHAERILHEAAIETGPVWASLYLYKSYILWQTGSFEQARQSAQQALVVFEKILEKQNTLATGSSHLTAIRRRLAGDPVDSGRTHLILGNLAAVMGDNKSALYHLQNALTIFEQFERQREIAMVCCNLGDVYLRRTEYALAQATLRRSLSIAENIGEVSIISGVFGNLGVVSARFGDLQDAETLFHQGLSSASEVNDLVYISLLQSYLSTVVLNQGNIKSSEISLRQALAVGRTLKFIPSIGIALVVLGQLRIAQSQIPYENTNNSPEIKNHRYSIQMLHKARKSLRHALALDGLEAETRTEGQLAQAQVSFLLGEIEGAEQQTLQAIEEARRFEQSWLLACARRLFGCILAAQHRYEDAAANFEQSLESLKQCGMRLEWARTLRDYNETILKRVHSSDKDCEQAVAQLQEARRTFQECGAVLDLELVERTLAEYATPVEVASHKRDR